VERSLDPALVRLALGETPGLPTVDEFVDLMVRAEIGLLLSLPQIETDLLGLAWHLHAVASSHDSDQRYGFQRQRAAFKVCGHILDLRLQTAETSPIERLELLLAAQIAFMRSELEPNTTAIYRREAGLLDAVPNVVADSDVAVLRVAVALLAFDSDFVFPQTSRLIHDLSQIAREWATDIEATPFAIGDLVIRACRDLIIFLTYGNVDRLADARERLARAVGITEQEASLTSRWVAAHLLNLHQHLGDSSIWTALPPEVPQGVRSAFVRVPPRALTLWPPQLDLLGTAEEVAPHILSDDAKRVFISTPTSGGKTLIAQLMIVSHVHGNLRRVCYVAPTRSLCHEVSRSLRGRLRHVAAGRVTSDLPEFVQLSLGLDDASVVEVMTPERLAHLLRTDAEDVLARFSMFVFDEVHAVGDGARGWTLEQVLTYLHFVTRDSDHRIVLISAAVGNRHHFRTWLGSDADGRAYHRDWRGPRSLHCVWSTNIDWDTSEELVTRSVAFPTRKQYPMYGLFHVRGTSTTRIRTFRTEAPVGHLVREYSPTGEARTNSQRSTPFYKTVADVVDHLADLGPVLCFESTRNRALKMAKAIAERRDTAPGAEFSPLVQLVRARLGDDHPLTAVLSKGVAYHHGSLPLEIRAGIEEAVSAGTISCIVATTTMAEGVNLPVRSVVIAAQGRHGAQGFQEYIIGPKLLNAIGRAGRATRETEGIVVLARQAHVGDADFDRLQPDDEALRVDSWLATAESLEALAQFEEEIRSAEDRLIEFATGAVGEFVSFVWFICAAFERREVQVDRAAVAEVLASSLGWVQLSDPDRTRYEAVSARIVDLFSQTATETRQRWAHAGTSLSSAAILDEIATELVQTIRTEGTGVRVAQAALDLILTAERGERIGQLHEAPRLGIFDRRGGGQRSELNPSLREVVKAWVSGSELHQIADQHFSDVPNLEFRFEQLGDYLNEYCETFLPWMLGVLVKWVNNSTEGEFEEEALPAELSAYVRWGVDQPAALNLLARGIRSRRLALAISRHWTDGEQDLDVVAWVRNMEPGEWLERFDASLQEINSLYELSREGQASVVGRLLEGQEVTLLVRSEFEDYAGSAASIRLEGEEAAPRITISVGDEVVATVRSNDELDVRDVLGSGVEVECEFRVHEGRAELVLRALAQT
jgi:hypothetical protein